MPAAAALRPAAAGAAAAEAPATDNGVLQCVVCGQAVEPQQAYCTAECSACGRLELHVWCAQKYTESRVRQVVTNSKRVEERKLAAKSKPWKLLKHGRCPRGWREGAQLSEQEQKQGRRQGKAAGGKGKAAEWGWEAIHACSGRIQSAALHDEPRETKEKKKKSKRRPAAPTTAGAAAGTAAAKQAPAGVCASTAAGSGPAKRAAAVGPAVAPMSAAKAKEFLGISSEEDSEESSSDAESSSSGGGGGGYWWSEEEEEEAEAEADAQGQLGWENGLEGPAVGSAELLEEQQEPEAAGRAVGQEQQLPPEALTMEEAEVAVRAGLLPPTYRTQLCTAYLHGSECPKRAACNRAHSLDELRVEAGIALGLLPVGFKTLMCQQFVWTGFCPNGRGCPMAHGVDEVRVLDAIRAGNVAPSYKTQRCNMLTMHGYCPQGLLCAYAHDPSELRREASVQQGCLIPTYKTALCPAFAASGSCTHGDWCGYAHGVHDLRLHAAIRDGVVPPTFHTRMCADILATGVCRRGNSCHFAHSGDDKLPHLLTKGTLCAVFKETGICRPGCPFAHNVNSLQLPLEPIQQKLLAALSKGPSTRLSAAALRAAEGSEATAAVSRSRQACEWDFAQPGSQASPAKSCPGDGGSVTRSGSASATAGATAASAAARRASGPASESGSGAAAAAARSSKQLAAARHEAQLAALLGNRSRPQELRQCIDHIECGRCYKINCPYAHGKRDLREREARWMEREQERRRARYELKQEERRILAEQEAREQQQQAVLLSLYGPTHQGHQLLSEQQQVQQQQTSRTAEEQLSVATLDLMRQHKIDLCVVALEEAGFGGPAAREAAEAAGGEAEPAFAILLDGGSSSARLPVDISGEAEDVMDHIRCLGLSTADAEEELILAGGDWEQAKQALSGRAEFGGRYDAGDWGSESHVTTAGTINAPAAGPPQLPLPLPVPLPVQMPLSGGSSRSKQTATIEAAAAAAVDPVCGSSSSDWGDVSYNTTELAASSLAGAAATPTVAAWPADVAAAAAPAALQPAEPDAQHAAVLHSYEAAASFKSLVDVLSDSWRAGQQGEGGCQPGTELSRTPAEEQPAAASTEPVALEELPAVSTATTSPTAADPAAANGCSSTQQKQHLQVDEEEDEEEEQRQQQPPAGSEAAAAMQAEVLEPAAVATEKPDMAAVAEPTATAAAAGEPDLDHAAALAGDGGDRTLVQGVEPSVAAGAQVAGAAAGCPPAAADAGSMDEHSDGGFMTVPAAQANGAAAQPTPAADELAASSIGLEGTQPADPAAKPAPQAAATALQTDAAGYVLTPLAAEPAAALEDYPAAMQNNDEDVEELLMLMGIH